MKPLFVFLAGTILSLSGLAQPVSTSLQTPTELPCFLKAGRFYIKIPTTTGDTLIGFCDTGGGYTAVYSSVLSKLHLEDKIAEIMAGGGKKLYIRAKDLVAVSSGVPYPTVGRMFRSLMPDPFFELMELDEESKVFMKYEPYDAFLGQFFYLEHAWTFDYLSGKVYLNTPVTKRDENTQPLGFKKDKDGNPLFGHGSMQITVDGQLIDVLFDTGASLWLSSNGRQALHTDIPSAAGSFIAQSVFDNWHQLHPGWRIVEKGESSGADLIEVPQVKVGNLVAGPVWFAKRPDEVWSKGMVRTMDKVVKGAVGGSFLQYFTVQADYNAGLIRFSR